MADQRQIIEAARALMPEWCDRSVQVLEFLDGGYSHANYRLRVDRTDYALRIASHLSDAQRTFEADWWQQLPAGLSAPFVRYGVHTGTLLTAWVEGPLLVQAGADDAALLSYLHDLHSRLPDPGRRYDLPALIDGWLPASLPAGVRRARTALTPLSDASPCHNDLNPWNVICTSPRWTSLDWEFVGANDPLFDVVALACGLGRDTHTVRALCQSYLGGSVRQERFDAQFAAFWLREYAWAVDQIARGNDRTEVLEQRDAALARLE